MNRILPRLLKTECLPLITLILSLTVLGGILFARVTLSQRLPYYDPLSYTLKAKNFWNSVEQEKWFNPLNLEPSTRAPGTVLLSYPFGFSKEFHGFYFRSTFLPIVLFVAALWIIGKPCCSTHRDRWFLLTLSLAFSTLPLFYHFERTAEMFSPTYWGLVDNFLAATAALATALVIRGFCRDSPFLTFIGALASAFCLLIKPAGLVVMGVIFLVWAAHVFLPRVSLKGVLIDHRSRTRYVFLGLFIFVFVYGLVVSLSLSSEYLSSANRASGMRALELLRDRMLDKDWWFLLKIFVEQIHTSFGLHWIFFAMLLYFASFRFLEGYSRRSDIREFEGMGTADLVSASIVAILGLLLWLMSTRLAEIRYFYPFALISITLSFPRVVSYCISVPGRFSKFVMCALPCPFLLLLLLLIPHNPPLSLQRLLGVNLTSGSLTNEIQQAKSLVDKAGDKGRDLLVYCPSLGFVYGVFSGVGRYNEIMHPDMHSFRVKRPSDWSRETTMRFLEIGSADYLVFEPLLDPVKASNILQKSVVPDFEAEQELFRAWLSVADENSGLEVDSETSLRLVRVIDHSKFADALEHLKTKYQWRKAFLNENPVKWIDRETVDALVAGSNEDFRDIRFGDKFVLLGIISRRTKSGLRLELFWESLKEQCLEYTNLIHVVDSAGRIRNQTNYAQDAAKRVVEKGTVWRDCVNIPARNLHGGEAIGIGIYIPPGTFLKADNCPTDWNGRRLLISIEQLTLGKQ